MGNIEIKNAMSGILEGDVKASELEKLSDKLWRHQESEDWHRSVLSNLRENDSEMDEMK